MDISQIYRKKNLVYIETCPFKAILCFLVFKKSHMLKIPSYIPLCFNLEIIPSCHALINAFDISRKTFWTSYSSPINFYISGVIDKSWLRQESPGLKPEWFFKIWPICQTLPVIFCKLVLYFKQLLCWLLEFVINNASF